ncbi:uncharacterised domain/N5-glutamine S-adenosyl-L -methionine-dependent methyltransferase fusion protein [Chryseobacterium nakagawai]|uniref:Uncharacterized protein n=1 Tax=Chryseobacterium nakagawai TaxID=1241982 RepID=A0AAD0YNH0_CHRNA|nr:hypothetical protein [Chryseobacterium nakagawai]AZA92067.1 hypothetical protein EG343_16295 [Chryseobacterium nakagawai]VEH18599.1 uncharacterised domain/N5-glutamine S-adenosyl-L -methionine-dependent methyltransferase fusion protein [Chryseobacterium nakagawai]
MKKTNLILLICLILYLTSLPFTAVYAKGHDMSGLACALLGWAEMDGGGIAWLANPLLFIGAFFLLLKQIKISAVLSLIAFGLTFCYLSVGEITVNEAGHKFSITGYGPGYFLWIASCFSLLIGNIILIKTSEKTHNPT